jgi:hypothetical protein
LEYSSSLSDYEVNGITVGTYHDVTYHKFDLENKIYSFRGKLKTGELVEYKIPMLSYYKHGVTHVWKTDYKGIDEVWLSTEIGNLGFDYKDGDRFAFYQLRNR